MIEVWQAKDGPPYDMLCGPLGAYSRPSSAAGHAQTLYAPTEKSFTSVGWMSAQAI